jgi:DNA primase
VIVPADVLAEIRARVDLVDLISGYVPLKRAGERWKGLCPFHQEKTPSFTVHPKLGIFHCFGCHVGGDAFEFLKRHDRLEFPETVRVLAERVGVRLPETPGARAEGGAREALYRLTDWAARRYEEWLWHRGDAERTRRYLTERGITPGAARTFRLGYAPEGWEHLLAAARAEGFAVDGLLAVGLVIPRPNGGGHYDRFRGRLIFPIADGQGRVIAFGGRALGAEEPKYLNSPESPLYQKGQTLYALPLARERIAASRRALLVEGYLDCLVAHQAGFAETVAVLGTALTPSHLGLLRRYADEVVLFFDADRAGRDAASRAEELLDQSTDPHWWAVDRKPRSFARRGLRLRVATLPAGHDPDTFLRQEGPAAFEARLRDARNLLLYAIDRILLEEDASTGRGKATSVDRVAAVMAKVQDADEAIELGREAARRLGVDPSDLWNYAQRLAARSAAPRPTAVPPAEAAPPSFDRDLLQLLVQVPEARAALAGLAEPRDVSHAGLRAILVALNAHPGVAPETLLGELQLPGEAERALLSRLLLDERPWPDPVALIADMRRRLERRQRQRRIREMSQAIARAQADGGPALADLRPFQAEARVMRALADPQPEAPAGRGEGPDRWSGRGPSDATTTEDAAS